MASNGNELSAKQHRAIAALLSTKSVTEAAEQAGVGHRTLCRWLTDPIFRAELHRAEGDLLDAATRRLLALQTAALETLGAVLDDPSAAASVRLRAAQTVLDSLLKLRELRNVEQRLAALEAALAEQQAR